MLYLQMEQNKYLAIKRLIDAGDLNSLWDLLSRVDKTSFSRDMGTSPERFNRLLRDPSKFEFRDIHGLAEILNVDEDFIFKMLYSFYKEQASQKRK
jgi:hypothetical protein